IRNKARLVAQGHTQEERIDYDEVFVPVARIEAIKLFLAYASFMGFTVYQMNVKSAFLYGTTDEEVGTIDQTLFIRRQRGDFILVQVYVDDIIFGSSNPHLCREFEALMHDKFQMSASLMYLTASRLDIMFAVCACARHQVTPKECHLHAVKRIFRYLKGSQINYWRVSVLDDGEATADRVSDDTEEMVTVLNSMDVATVLASGVVDVPTGTGSIPNASLPAAEVPTGSDVVPTATPVFAIATVVTPYRRRKGKEIMVESETPKKKKVQEQIDAQVARDLEEQMAREDQRMSEQVARDAEIARIYAEEELIASGKKNRADSDLVRSNLGWKVKDFRGMTFEEIEAKFTIVWKQLEDFIPMGSKKEAERLKRKGLSLEQESAKKLKTSDEVPEEVKSPDEVPKEKVKEMMQLVPIEENLMHALVEWKLYDMCGVHQVTSKDKEIFMLVEKDYPLKKGLALVMICYKLQLEHQFEGRIIRNKMHKAFPLPVIEFPLVEEVPTASEESCHCQKKREATAVKIALLV
nr:putative ribonuclease H-like domain-containing protein [Tanacetum cinerariifolium]